MVQSIDPAAQSALDTHYVIERGCVRFEFPSGSYGFWTGQGSITLDSMVFESGGALFNVEQLDQDINGNAIAVAIRLSSHPNTALTSDVLSTIEDEAYKNRPVRIYTAYFNIDTGAFLDLVTEFNGIIDTIDHQIRIGGERTLTANCESRAIDLKRANGGVRGDEDQRQIDNLDRS